MPDTNPQWYLITSSRIPSSNWFFRGNPDHDNFDMQDTFSEDFGQVLTPMGEDLEAIGIPDVPEDTVFAGFVWGDGTYFSNDRDLYGILGEFRATSSDTYDIYGPNGQFLIQDGFEDDDTLPRIIPPEAFGLQCKSWWKTVYPWCKK